LICPEGFYRGTIRDFNCYRDGIISLELIVYKKDNKYIITPNFSTFRNSFVRDNFNSIYSFYWALDGIDTSNSSNTKLFPTYFRP